MKIGMIGLGFVGDSTMKSFGFLGHDVKGYDKYKDSHSLDEVLEHSEVVFTSLPTPSTKKGIDLSIYREVFAQMTGYNKPVIIKSTVLPGTCRALGAGYDLDISHNPEFLVQDTALLDAINPHKIVIGCDNEDHRPMIQEIYKDFRCPQINTDTITAELIKYACNCELAMQVSYANELFEICKNTKADYEKVREAMSADKRIGTFKRVDLDDRGYSGACFPKDTTAFYKWSDSDMVGTTIKVNERVRGEKQYE